MSSVSKASPVTFNQVAQPVWDCRRSSWCTGCSLNVYARVESQREMGNVSVDVVDAMGKSWRFGSRTRYSPMVRSWIADEERAFHWLVCPRLNYIFEDHGTLTTTHPQLSTPHHPQWLAHALLPVWLRRGPVRSPLDALARGRALLTPLQPCGPPSSLAPSPPSPTRPHASPSPRSPKALSPTLRALSPPRARHRRPRSPSPRRMQRPRRSTSTAGTPMSPRPSPRCSRTRSTSTRRAP
jgi:hypothetical protein